MIDYAPYIEIHLQGHAAVLSEVCHKGLWEGVQIESFGNKCSAIPTEVSLKYKHVACSDRSFSSYRTWC